MKKNNLFLILFLFAFLFITFRSHSQSGDVMLQGFNWESNKSSWYDLVKGKAADLQTSGINTIWLPPPSDAASPQGYLPRELYKLDTKYGTKAQLQSLIATLHSNNIKVLADIVINHRVGLTNWGDFTNPTWGCWAAVTGDEWTGACGGNDTGSGYSAARDLDHTNTTVRNDLKAWMNWLKGNIGFDGWRYDLVHGYGANFIKEYNDATTPYFSVGENWNSDKNVINNWINGTQGSSTAFDFALKGVLQNAVNGQLNLLNDNGKAPGVIGINPSHSVTFIDNHDTGSTQNHWPFPGDKVMQGYAYILTHPGIPMVFWDHFYDWGLHDEIKALIKVRKDNALTSTSSISIQRAESNLYAAIIDGKVAMKIGSTDWNPGTGWTLKASGNNYAVWSKSGGTTPASFTVYFKKPSTWASSIKIHYWNALPTGSLANTNWPGISMAEDGNGWYKYSFSNVSSVNLLFHDNNGHQTADLTRNKNGWYDNGIWYDADPRTASTGLKIHLKTTWTSPKLYYWNPSPAGAPSVSWPGASMISEGNGWYYYTIPSANCSNLIFSNNGSSQTADLYRCGEGWYYNKTWYNSQPAARLIEVEEGSGKSESLILDQNFPNPFFNQTNISFYMPHSAHAKVTVTNLYGKVLAVIADQSFEKGYHSLCFPKGNLISGVYIYKIEVGQKCAFKKFVVE